MATTEPIEARVGSITVPARQVTADDGTVTVYLNDPAERKIAGHLRNLIRVSDGGSPADTRRSSRSTRASEDRRAAAATKRERRAAKRRTQR